MEKYKQYMDGVAVSDTLHRRLLNLEAPKKHIPAWRKYGGLAAALVLVLGIGAWAIRQAMHTGHDLPCNATSDADAEPDFLYMGYPEIADEPAPDIAIAEPGDIVEPGTKTDGGYEVRGPENGPDTVVAYYMLPYIEYGMTKNVAQMSLDWDLPKGSTRRDLTQADIDALFGGAANLSTHLDWEGYELTGWAAWYEDGSFWGLFINGYMGPLDHFELALTAGNTYPPTCIGYPGGVEQTIWDLTVTAYGHDSVASPSGGVDASGRRVEFLNDGYGYRFDITGRSRSLTQERVGRLVRWIATEGLALDTLTQDGAELVHPWEADPGYSVGEPNREDSVPDYDSGCPYCADGTAHTHPYNPQEAADPSYHAPSPDSGDGS